MNLPKLSSPTKVKINLVAFVVGALGLIYAMASQVLTVLQPHYSVFVTFPNSGGVFTSQEVDYRGVTIGSVGNMKLVQGGVRIELVLNDTPKIPAQGTTANVLYKSAVGEQLVDLVPSTTGAPYLHEGSTISKDHTTIPVQTQALLTTLQDVLSGIPPKAVRGAVNELGRGLTGRGGDLATIIESSARLADLFAERAPTVQGILTNGTKVGGAFIQSKDDFERAIVQLVVVSDALGGSTDELENLLRGSNLTADQVTKLINQNRPALDAFLHRFAEVNKLQANHSDDLALLFKYLPKGLHAVANTFESKTGLVRFGLVNDTNSPPCSYGTRRRPPQMRGSRDVPRDAHCKKSKQQAGVTGVQPTSNAPGASTVIGGPAPTSGLLGGSPVLPGQTTIPTQTSEWSWTLLYLPN